MLATRPYETFVLANGLLSLFALGLIPETVSADSTSVPTPGEHRNLIAQDAWVDPDSVRWTFQDDRLGGMTLTFPEIPTDDIRANSFLLSNAVFGGDLVLSMDIVFEQSRYLGVYLDYDPLTDTGMWLATGHPLPEGASGDPRVEMAYIKTVDNGNWTVRATGQLVVAPGEELRLRWVKSGNDYSIWQDDRLVVGYRPERTYEPGRIQFRLMSAVMEIDRLEMAADWIE